MASFETEFALEDEVIIKDLNTKAYVNKLLASKQGVLYSVVYYYEGIRREEYVEAREIRLKEDY